MFLKLMSALVGLVLAGTAVSKADAPATAGHSPQTTSVIIHLTNLDFVTASGSSAPYPSGKLSPGDRIIGRDDVLQHGSSVGSDYEVCTVGFGLNVLCDDMVEITNVGQLRVSWMFQWPSSGTSGPSAWDGVVDGGTGDYQNAIGTFKAQALPNGDTSITFQIVRSP